MPGIKSLRAAVLLLAISSAAMSATDPTAFDSKAVQPSGLTKEQAKQVLVIVLKHLKFNLAREGMYLDGDITAPSGGPFHPGYYDFALTYDTPDAAATDVLGSYAVSLKTGDVWEVNLCKRYAFPALTRVQVAIMQRTGQTFASEKNERRGLGCSDE
jgi:hypothetical protein